MDMNLDGISKETGMNLGCTHPAMCNMENMKDTKQRWDLE